MKTPFTTHFFASNRKKLQTISSDVSAIFVAANIDMQRNHDSTYRFRQDSTFWYLTGLEIPAAVLCMDLIHNQHIIILPKRHQHEILFDGAFSEKELITQSGVDKVVYGSEGWRDVVRAISSASNIGTLSVSPSLKHVKGSYIHQKQLITRLKRSFGADALVYLDEAVRSMRIIKSPMELRAMQKAAASTCKGFIDVYQNLDSASFEYELEATMNYSFRRHGLEHAYSPIVAAGVNACTLHYIRNDGKLFPGQHVLLDCGAEYSNYASDVTRTYNVGTVSARRKSVYEAVAQVHKAMCGFVRPGITLREVERHAVDLIARQLISLGLVGSTSSPLVRTYFPHAVSHFVGLDVHDVGSYDEELASGMVLTIEPGIYIPDEHIGVRVEDTVVVTENGIDIITADAPYM